MTEATLQKSSDCAASVETSTQGNLCSTQVPLDILYKVARRNRLHVSWHILDESGPPHCPVFSVQLLLLEPNSKETEQFYGLGKRLRDAKHVAAADAIEHSSILGSILRKEEVRQQKPPRSKEHQLLQNLSRNVPHPSGPRAEILQLAHLLRVGASFHRLPNPSDTSSSFSPSMLSTTFTPFCDNKSSSGLHRVALCFGGRQFVGEASTVSGAEQEASAAVLKALRLVLNSLETFRKRERCCPPQPDQSIHFRPNCPVWRLQVLAGLHHLHPSFKAFLSDFTTIDESVQKTKKVYRCICSLPSFEPVESIGPSKSIARKRAAEVMLNCLVPEHSSSASPPIECPQSSAAPRSIRFKSAKTKTGQSFKLDRASPGYGTHVHPMARLYYIASAKGIAGPKCKVTTDEAVLSNGPQLLEGCVTRYPSQFRCEMYFDKHSTVGPPAPSKQLAKRFAAESMLKLIGFDRPKSPTPKGVLRPPPAELQDASSVPQENSDCSHPVQLKCSNNSNHTRHIAFSSTMDVLVLDDSAASASRKPFRTHSTRITYPNKANSFELRTNRKVSRRTSSAPSLLSLSVCSNQGFSNSPIGHWSDSEEAMGFTDSVLFRRSRSCSIPDVNENDSRDRGLSAYDLALLRASLPRRHSSSQLPNYSPPKQTLLTAKMCLLSRLAVFFLKENSMKCTVAGDARVNACPDATKQLLSLCQRLQIPCKFIDQPPRQEWLGETDRKIGSSDALQHHTLLVVGESVSDAFDENEPPASQNTVIARALGLSMSSARQQASLTAFRQLAELQSHFV